MTNKAHDNLLTACATVGNLTLSVGSDELPTEHQSQEISAMAHTVYTWTEISDERADELLEVLPPIYIPGGFMVGEALDHDERGVPVYRAVVTVNGRWWTAALPYDQRNMARITTGEAC